MSIAEKKLQFPNNPQQLYTDDAPLLSVQWWHKSRYAQYISAQLKDSLTTTGTTTDHLIDSGEVYGNVVAGDIVHNETDDTFAEITVVATGDLTLTDDIMITGEVYSIYCEPSPGYGWVEYAGQTIDDPESLFNGLSLENLVGDNRFIRAWKASGNSQADATAMPTSAFTTDDPGDHSHVQKMNNMSSTFAHQNNGGAATRYDASGSNNGTTGVDGAHTHSITGGGDSETRPINISMVPIVKIKSNLATITSITSTNIQSDRFLTTNKLDTNDADTDWHVIGDADEPAFQNSWVAYGGTQMTPRFRKDAMGFVHIHGSVKSGTLNTLVFTLPAGYRPSAAMTFACAENGNTNVSRTYVTAVGLVQVHAAVNTQNHFNGVTFYAEN